MSKKLIKDMIAGAVDGDYYSFANAVGELVENRMREHLVEVVADIKENLFTEGNTKADQDFNNLEQKKATKGVGKFDFNESVKLPGEETGDPAEFDDSSDDKAKDNSDNEDPSSAISPSDKQNKGSVSQGKKKDVAGTSVIKEMSDEELEEMSKKKAKLLANFKGKQANPFGKKEEAKKKKKNEDDDYDEFVEGKKKKYEDDDDSNDDDDNLGKGGDEDGDGDVDGNDKKLSNFSGKRAKKYPDDKDGDGKTNEAKKKKYEDDDDDELDEDDDEYDEDKKKEKYEAKKKKYEDEDGQDVGDDDFADDGDGLGEEGKKEKYAEAKKKKMKEMKKKMEMKKEKMKEAMKKKKDEGADFADDGDGLGEEGKKKKYEMKKKKYEGADFADDGDGLGEEGKKKKYETKKKKY